MDAEWVRERIDFCEELLGELSDSKSRPAAYLQGQRDAYKHMLEEMTRGR